MILKGKQQIFTGEINVRTRNNLSGSAIMTKRKRVIRDLKKKQGIKIKTKQKGTKRVRTAQQFRLPSFSLQNICGTYKQSNKTYSLPFCPQFCFMFKKNYNSSIL